MSTGKVARKMLNEFRLGMAAYITQCKLNTTVLHNCPHCKLTRKLTGSSLLCKEVNEISVTGINT